MDIGTRKIYNEDHDMFRESCRKFWASIDLNRVRKWEELRGATPDIWKEAGAAGLLCIDTPAEYGGIGSDFLHTAVACEEQCYAGPDFYGPGLGLHTSIGKWRKIKMVQFSLWAPSGRSKTRRSKNCFKFQKFSCTVSFQLWHGRTENEISSRNDFR